MNHPEAIIQAEIVKYLGDRKVFCFSVWNEGGGASAMRTSKAITTGLKPGVADLEVLKKN
ncbi:MAG: hypothetical protein WBI82_01760 [Sphaerochaeta sp.]